MRKAAAELQVPTADLYTQEVRSGADAEGPLATGRSTRSPFSRDVAPVA